MEWNEAKSNTLDTWGRIRRAVDKKDELELLTEINAICDLCVAAKQDAGEGNEPCPHCPAYEQFGGCRQVNAEMSALVVEKDWDGLRQAVDDFIADLRDMDVEPDLDAGPPV